MELKGRLGKVASLAVRAAEVAWGTALAYRPIRRGPGHGLDRELVVSLTSYPPRYKTLHRTLRCLLNQSVSPDRLVLWIAEGDMALLPARVRALEGRGLTIAACPDFRSLKKILPAIEAFPESYVVTADDDVYYRRDWLRDLVRSAQPETRDIVAHDVRRAARSGNGLASIAEWQLNVTGPQAERASDDLFPVGVGGVLYPPHSLHPDVADYATFAELCPTCDDSWLAWMARRQGTKVRRSGAPKTKRLIAWEGTNAGSLSSANFNYGAEELEQDRIFARLSERYGPLHRLIKGAPG